MIAGVGLPISVLYIVFGDAILGLFGEPFRDAHGALIILVIGQLFNIGTGVVGWVVIMAGYETKFAQYMTLSAVLHLISILIFASTFGLLGGIVATSFFNAFANVLMAIFAYRRLKVNPTIF